ncbi:MAG TPA: AAA family ATPase, partial [Longimicrobiales bacterium]|nr:AAA family ATPase [Longimicrobiales bacterium]
VADTGFDQAAGQIADSTMSSAQLLSYASGANAMVCYLASEALARRAGQEDLAEPLLRLLDERYGWRGWFVLRALHVHASSRRTAVIGPVVVRLTGFWETDPDRDWLAEFVTWREAAGELATLREVYAELDALGSERRVALDAAVTALGDVLPAAILGEYEAWRRQRTDTEFLQSVGQILEGAELGAGEIIDEPYQQAAADALLGALTRDPPRATVVMGEAGVGKSTVIARLAGQLHDEGWTIFRCSAAQLLAGQSYIGQMEERVLRLARELENRRILWIVPDFHQLLHAGVTMHSPTGLLDHVFPFLERGTVHMVGETSPSAYARVLQQRPRLRAAVEAVRIEPLDAGPTAVLAAEWCRRNDVPEAVLREAQQLASQHLVDRQPPGNLLTLLKLTVLRARAQHGPEAEVQSSDLLQTMARLTGLPLDILDDRAALDLDRVREFFTARVIGQDEAVDVLLDRIALIKAGLTDPTRPQGVYFFVGPSGTGKTELAKALAEYLFGSPDRMIRLDMSELQEQGTTHRLLGSPNQLEAGSALVDQVRRQPFCVVLLDEFEKAHPQIWDLFLQLFDDGRLTDHDGNTASFRNAIIIMTSNLGADARAAGFGASERGSATYAGQRRLEQTFRPEFINRIDRVVWFRPLGRAVMRRLLDKEIREVLGRRGLRDRGWAIEWEESAIELLITKSFSPSLGARPLKRAVERYLLAPLATSIVGRRIPEGDQFLYIGSSGDNLTVEFVDPDADTETSPAEAAPGADLETPALEDIVRDGRGDALEVEALTAEYDHLAGTLAGEAWQRRKQQALARMADPGFWDSAGRYAVMGLAEYMDRIEVGFDTAGSLLRRITRSHEGSGGRFPPHLVRRLAQQLYLVGEAIDGLAAGLPRDAFIRISAAHDPGVDPAHAAQFARRIERMYRSWADRRRMRLQVLDATPGQAYCALLAISGFAAYPILAAEHGQHVLELPGERKTFSRVRVQVLVAPQPEEPPAAGGTLRLQAERALQQVDTGRAAVVRRYRDEPSPLVRDGVRRWRTGRIDQVMDGDFDIVG